MKSLRYYHAKTVDGRISYPVIVSVQSVLDQGDLVQDNEQTYSIMAKIADARLNTWQKHSALFCRLI